jgi:hypothetical protein
MQTPHRVRPPLVYALPLFVLAIVLAFAVTSRAPRERHDPTDPPHPNGAPRAQVATLPEPPAAAEPEPTEPLARAAVPAAPPAPEPTFEQRIDALVLIGQRTAALAQQDDQAAATASDQEAREVFAALLVHFPDAGERALAVLTELPDTPQEPLIHGRRIVLQLVLRAECERRDLTAADTRDRSGIDGLVQGVLDVMPISSVATEAGAFVLVDQRFLRTCHEAAVLRLVQLAGELKFSREVATKLLLTLWDNLQRFGERSSDEVSRLALLLLGDGDPSQRTAACRQLLRDPRYRNLVLAQLRTQSDRAVAKDLAMLAASELPPAEAVALLRELAPVLPQAAGQWLALGHRAPDSVADGYRELLAASIQPQVRRDMITGVGMAHTPLGLEIAQLALENDPSADVREQAVMALSARRENDVGERALQRALDDPAFAQNPARLAGLVFALQNLESAGQTNAVDRLGQRLRLLPLAADSRRTLEAILARSLPGGQSSLTGSGGR